MALDSIQLQGTAPGAVKFIYYSLAQTVYNAATTAYEAWNDSHYANYLVTATQQGTSNRWTATRPAGVSIPFICVARKTVDSTPSGDTQLGSGSELLPEAAPGGAGGVALFGGAMTLTANGLDAIATTDPTAHTAIASLTFPQRLNVMFLNHMSKNTMNVTTGQRITFGSDGVTPLYTQAVTSTQAIPTETVGVAS